MTSTYKIFPTIAQRAEQDGDYEKHMNTIKSLDYGQSFYLVYEIEEMLECWKKSYDDIGMSPFEKRTVIKTLRELIPTIERLYDKADNENKEIAKQVVPKVLNQLL